MPFYYIRELPNNAPTKYRIWSIRRLHLRCFCPTLTYQAGHHMLKFLRYLYSYSAKSYEITSEPLLFTISKVKSTFLRPSSLNLIPRLRNFKFYTIVGSWTLSTYLATSPRVSSTTAILFWHDSVKS